MGVPARVLAIAVCDQGDKPRRGRCPTVDDDAAAAALQLAWLGDRQLKTSFNWRWLLGGYSGNGHSIQEDVGLQLAVHSAINRQVADPLLGEHLVVDEEAPGTLAAPPRDDRVGRVGHDARIS